MSHQLFQSAPNKGEQAQRRLLLAALEKFGDKGFENASVREIADEAGQNVAAISYYFGNKESLYVAVLSGIGDYLDKVYAGVTHEVVTLEKEGGLTAEVSRELLKRVLKTLLNELGSDPLSRIRNVMIREQSSPSPNFDVLYQRTLLPLHRLLALLVGTATGSDPKSTATILRSHAIFGQVIVFQIARSTIQRRLGVEKLKPAHFAEIATLIDQHIECICNGLNPIQP
ncbi:MAG: DUF1956 domain-containing protein [Verrucomicrobiaceae bacterium]|nr:MAG: DUF1956 domain-containing protein [Verrucomicrobiaceae bacterium]